jgi:Cdc6-like AAA superfamily ATPase
VQEHLRSILNSQKIPHALLFAGPRGGGKKNAAHQFVAALLQTKKNIENHPDVHLFYPEGKTGMHPVSAIRKLIEDAALSPFEAQWKTFLLHEAEKMLPTSSNALLKILEEPPPQTVILLLSDHPERLLPTILSRCQTITFLPQEKNVDLATLALLAEEAPREKLADFESEHPDAVFETLLFWYRDRLLLEIGGSEKYLHFPDHLSQLKKTPFVPLEEVEKAVKQARLACERSMKLSTCLEMFVFKVKLISDLDHFAASEATPTFQRSETGYQRVDLHQA